MNKIASTIAVYISRLFEPSEERVDELLADVLIRSPALKLKMVLSTLNEEPFGDNGLGVCLPPHVQAQSNPVFRACVDRVLESVLFFDSAYPLTVRELFYFFETASFRAYVPLSDYELWASYLVNKTLAGFDIRRKVVVLEEMLLRGNNIDWRLSSHMFELILIQAPAAETAINWARLVREHRNSVHSMSTPSQTLVRNHVRTLLQQWKRETAQTFEHQKVL